jgi:hypothetical protein
VAQENRKAADDTKRQELLAFVDRCFMAGCSEAAHGITAGGPDRRAYLERRDALLALGVASWRNAEKPRAGWKMAVSRFKARELIARHVI